MQTPHNSPVRDRLLHKIEFNEVAFWKDQVAYMGLMLWNMRHREPTAPSESSGVPPPPHPPPPPMQTCPVPSTDESVLSTSVVGSFTPSVPFTTGQNQRTVRYAYPERQYVN